MHQVQTTYPQALIDAFNGIDNLNAVPVLKISKDRFHGDYIDFLTPNDFGGKSGFRRGKDPWGRYFLAVCMENCIGFEEKVEIYKEEDEEDQDNHKEYRTMHYDQYDVFTIFQRYADQGLWTIGELNSYFSRIHKLFHNDRRELYGIPVETEGKSLTEEEYYDWFPFKTSGNRNGVYRFVKFLRENDMKVYKDSFLPPRFFLSK